MKVGLTYDLQDDYLTRGYSEEDVAELDQRDTIDALAAALSQRGHVPRQIGGAMDLASHLAAGERWDLVFNIAEGLYGEARESQVPALLDVFRVPYTFSSPLVLAVCLDKGLAKRVVRDAGVPTAPFFVVEPGSSGPQIELTPPLFVKPVAEGSSMGVTTRSLVEDPAMLGLACADVWERFHQPALVEEFLPGREFTVGILGTGPAATAIGTLEIVLRSGAEPTGYTFANKKDWDYWIDYQLVSSARDPVVAEAEAVALAAWSALRCRDAGRVDIRLDRSGTPCFVEVNPLAGLNPRTSDLPILWRKLGLEYVDLIDRIVQSAWPRVRDNGFRPHAPPIPTEAVPRFAIAS